MSTALTYDYNFDFETHLIGGNEREVCQCGEVHGQFPPAVCMSYACDNDEGKPVSGLMTAAQGIATLWDRLHDANCILVGHETSFDVLVSVENAALAGLESQAMLEAWVKAYDANRVRDTSIRQKLLDLARGRYRWHRHPNGSATRINYDLGTTSERNKGPRLNKDDVWRKRYAELDGVPLKRWPAEAKDYARLDAVATRKSFQNQANWSKTTDIRQRWQDVELFPEGGEADPFSDEHAQTCHALWIKDMTGWGIRTDAAAIEKYRARAQKEYDSLAVENLQNGLIRREYWRDLKALREQGHELKGNALWKDLKSWLDQDDDEAWAYWKPLEKAGLVSYKLVRNQNDARELMLQVCEENSLPIPRTKTWEKKVLLSERGECEEPDYEDGVAIDAEACRVSEDDRLIAYADLTHQAKILGADVPQLLLGVDHPIHSHFESLLETGRISSAGPNITNRARGEKDRAGDRECFVPRKGFVLLDYDFAQLELYALAQVCRWVLGYSTLGDALLNNIDPHTDLAAAIRGCSYEEAVKLNEKKMLPERDSAKGYNFGRPGGLGTKTFSRIAGKAYGVYKTREQWDEVFEIGDRKWREMPHYFSFIESLGNDNGDHDIAQAWSGRLRAKCSYCQASNTWYQGLGADVAKLAGWYLFKAARIRGVDQEFFGCRMVNFIHDQFLIECKDVRSVAARAAKRVEFWCGVAAKQVLPDYGWKMAQKSDCILARRWSKQAKRVLDQKGNLIAWEDERLAS